MSADRNPHFSRTESHIQKTTFESYFLSQLGQVNEDTVISFQENVQAFIDEASGKSRLEEEALLAIFLRDFFPKFLVPQQISEIRNLILKSYKTSSLLQQYLTTIDTAAKAVIEYFNRPVSDYDYFIPTPIKSEVGNRLVNLRLEELVKQTQAEFAKINNPNLIIENFQLPNSEVISVWMSTRGIQYNPQMIK